MVTKGLLSVVTVVLLYGRTDRKFYGPYDYGSVLFRTVIVRIRTAYDRRVSIVPVAAAAR